MAALCVLSSLKRELGDLDRVTAWLVVHGLVYAAPGFGGTAGVINGFSDLILELYGPEAGMPRPHGPRRGDAPAQPGRLRRGGGRDTLMRSDGYPVSPSTVSPTSMPRSSKKP